MGISGTVAAVALFFMLLSVVLFDVIFGVLLGMGAIELFVAIVLLLVGVVVVVVDSVDFFLLKCWRGVGLLINFLDVVVAFVVVVSIVCGVGAAGLLLLCSVELCAVVGGLLWSLFYKLYYKHKLYNNKHNQHQRFHSF